MEKKLQKRVCAYFNDMIFFSDLKGERKIMGSVRMTIYAMYGMHCFFEEILERCQEFFLMGRGGRG